MTIVIFITGQPATGKTTLAKDLERKLNLSLISRDALKEILYDNLGWDNREWSKKLGKTSFELLYFFLEQSLKNGHSIIVEANFDPLQSNEKLKLLKKKYSFQCIQVYCEADKNVILKRFEERNRDKGRHPGHIDYQAFSELEIRLKNQINCKLDIQCKNLIYNTNIFDNKSAETIVTQVTKLYSELLGLKKE